MRLRTTIFVTVLFLFNACAGMAQRGGARPHSPCRHWKAWQDVRPGMPSTLHVTATCKFPTAGYSVEMVPAAAAKQGSTAYILKRVVHKPDGMAAQVLSEVPVNYQVETQSDYKEVRIKPDRIRVAVKQVH